MKSKKMIVATPCKTRVLDYEKDSAMICYHIYMNAMGKSLKWHQKLGLWTFCKFSDLKFLIVNGFKRLISK